MVKGDRGTYFIMLNTEYFLCFFYENVNVLKTKSYAPRKINWLTNRGWEFWENNDEWFLSPILSRAKGQHAFLRTYEV